jgi:hypothetical protein
VASSAGGWRSVKALRRFSAQEQKPEQDQTLVVVPHFPKKDIIYGPYAREEDVNYTVSSMDPKGKLTPVKDDKKMELDEKLVGGNPKTRICNPGECVSKGSLPDTMTVTASGGGHSVEKRFQVDGKAARIYDAATKKAYNFVRVDASVKKGFVFTYGNDPN